MATEADADWTPQDALKFHQVMNQLRRGEAVQWPDYELLMTRIEKKLCADTGCNCPQAELRARAEKPFVYLSPDIIYDIVWQFSFPKDLLSFYGPWRDETLRRREHIKETDASLACMAFPKTNRQFTTIMQKASQLHGTLSFGIFSLCMPWCIELISRLQPHFHEIFLTFHMTEMALTREQLHIVTSFLNLELESTRLRRLFIMLNGDIGITEQQLMAFCRSNQFQYLSWGCGPLSAEFFIGLYSTFKDKRFPPDCQNREISGFIDRSTLAYFAQALNLKYDKNVKAFTRRERCSAAEQRWISLSTEFNEDTARVSVGIKVAFREVGDEPSEVNDNTEGDKFVEVPYRRIYWKHEACDGECALPVANGDDRSCVMS